MKAVPQWRPWVENSGGGHGLNADVRIGLLTAVSHMVSFFSTYPKLGQTCKIKMDALSCYKNSQFLYDARLENYEQLSQLFQLKIHNII
jgi:hypothetical protein